MVDDSTESQVRKEMRKHPGLIGDFLVEFLGGLIPGIIFIVALIFIFSPPLHMFMSSISNTSESFNFRATVAKIIMLTKGTPYMVWLGVFIFGLILSYVLGHLFYRRDPKKPNRRSFKRIIKNHPDDQELKETFGNIEQAELEQKRKEWRRRNYACDNEKDCEFPFPYLREYLIQRGHNHLLRFVKWKDNKNLRSKTYINSLKIKLQYYAPHEYQRVIRNEAHVRLSTSTWYMSRALMIYSYVGIAICIFSTLILLVRMLCFSHIPFEPFGIGLVNWLIAPIIAPFLVWILSFYCSRSNEEFIHYQRIREVFYVLELSSIVANNNQEFLQMNLEDDAEDQPQRAAKEGIHKKNMRVGKKTNEQACL